MNDTEITPLKIRVRESDVRFIHGRIDLVHHYFGLLCETFGCFTRKIAAVRDKGDDIAQILLLYADEENVNDTLRNGMVQFASVIAAIQDYQQARIDHLEDVVVCGFCKYENFCKMAKDEVQLTLRFKDMHNRQCDKLKKLKSIPASVKKINRVMNLHMFKLFFIPYSQEETKLYKVTAEACKNMSSIEKLIDDFEYTKIHDIKNILASFVKTEMAFHAKALELYSKAWEVIAKIDDKKDLQEFRNYMSNQKKKWDNVIEVDLESNFDEDEEQDIMQKCELSPEGTKTCGSDSVTEKTDQECAKPCKEQRHVDKLALLKQICNAHKLRKRHLTKNESEDLFTDDSDEYEDIEEVSDIDDDDEDSFEVGEFSILCQDSDKESILGTETTQDIGIATSDSTTSNSKHFVNLTKCL